MGISDVIEQSTSLMAYGVEVVVTPTNWLQYAIERWPLIFKWVVLERRPHYARVERAGFYLPRFIGSLSTSCSAPSSHVHFSLVSPHPRRLHVLGDGEPATRVLLPSTQRAGPHGGRGTGTIRPGSSPNLCGWDCGGEVGPTPLRYYLRLPARGRGFPFLFASKTSLEGLEKVSHFVWWFLGILEQQINLINPTHVLPFNFKGFRLNQVSFSPYCNYYKDKTTIGLSLKAAQKWSRKRWS
jgi:hypothetical protein